MSPRTVMGRGVKDGVERWEVRGEAVGYEELDVHLSECEKEKERAATHTYT